MSIILYLLLIPLNVSSKLLFVVEHFRHGARGPCNKLDKDMKDRLKIKWDTIGELTEVGQRMHYVLGYEMYLQYKSFLSYPFNPNEVTIMSSNINRTIQSLSSHLIGLYPYSTGPSIKEEQKQMALPPNKLTPEVKSEIDKLGNNVFPNKTNSFTYNIYHVSQRSFLLEQADVCKPISDIRAKNSKKKTVVQRTNKFNETYGKSLHEFLNHTENIDVFTDIGYVDTFCDHFIADYTEKRNLSSLETILLKNKLNISDLKDSCISILDMVQREIVNGDERVAKMSQGPIFREILNYMTNKVNEYKQYKNKKNSPKMFIISGHDNTVMSMQIFLQQIFNTAVEYIYYAGNIVFELHVENEEFNVKYKINGNLVDTFKFDIFKNKILTNVWNDKQIKNFCEFEDNTEKPNNNYKIIFVSLCVACVIMITLIILLLICVKKDNDNNVGKFNAINF